MISVDHCEVQEFVNDSSYISGLTSYKVSLLQEHLGGIEDSKDQQAVEEQKESDMIRIEKRPGSGGGSDEDEVIFENFPPGSVIAFL